MDLLFLKDSLRYKGGGGHLGSLDTVASTFLKVGGAMSLFLFIYCIIHTEIDSFIHTFTEIHSFIHTFITFAEACSRFPHRLSLSREISIGVPGRDLNPRGLPYSRPTQYCLSYTASCLSYAAPKSEQRCTQSDLCRTQVWTTPHPIWITPHPNLSYATRCLSYTASNLSYAHPSPSYAAPCLSYTATKPHQTFILSTVSECVLCQQLIREATKCITT